jgi:hypothetical protein
LIGRPGRGKTPPTDGSGLKSTARNNFKSLERIAAEFSESAAALRETEQLLRRNLQISMPHVNAPARRVRVRVFPFEGKIGPFRPVYLV